MNETLTALETRIIEEHTPLTNKSKLFLKEHYSAVLKLINQIMFDEVLQMNEFQYMLMVHLFTLASKLSYIPSAFVQFVAEMSSFTKIELVGMPMEAISAKSIDFLSMYYKIVSEIMNNKYIKRDKKELFEKIVSEKLNERTVKWLIDLFTRTDIKSDQNTKILLKAITQTKFEFFEAFAENFKKTLYELILKQSSYHNTNWMNKYVFKIIEKCMIKLPHIEPEFLLNLGKVCHSIIDLFVQKKNTEIKKLYQLSMRLMYIIYDKRKEKNSKLIKFFTEKFSPILEKPRMSDEFVSEILSDFVEVNFTILAKSKDLDDFYFMFQTLLEVDKSNAMKYIKCIEMLFKYEMEKTTHIITEIPYIKKLLKGFTTNSSNQKQITIEILYLILVNAKESTTRKILEELTLTHFSFFAEKTNDFILDRLLQAIMPKLTQNVKGSSAKEDIAVIYDYYIKYFDLLLTHALNEHDDVIRVFGFISNINDPQKMFEMSLLFANKYFVYLHNAKKFTPLSQAVNDVVIEFIRLLAITSCNVKRFPKKQYQSILNVYAFFVMYQKLNYPPISDFAINELATGKEKDFTFYLLVFARNIPELVFNKNTSKTIPIKIEAPPSLLNELSERKKDFANEFQEFGDVTEIEKTTQIYLVCIYYQFIAKLLHLNYIFDDMSRKNRYSIVTEKRISLEDLISTKVSIISLLHYATDNIFLISDKRLTDFLSKMFHKFFEKYFSKLKNYKYNTSFKQTLLSYDLKLLLNFTCHFHSAISSNATQLINTYSKSFPFLLNEYDIFEYYVNVLGELISYSVKHYDYFISEIPMDDNFEPLLLPSEKKTTNEIYCTLYKIFEKCLQSSYMINNNNITYNIANYMNHYLVNNNGFASTKEGMNYSVNLLQKIYNNVKKIEIPSLIKTSAYLDPEKFTNYLKTHVKKNFDKYLSMSSLDDIYSPADYAKNTKLQIRNKYIGIVEGKINNLRIENKNDNDLCYYKYKYEVINAIQQLFANESDIDVISKKIAPIIIELTAFIVYSNMDVYNEFVTSFDQRIINDEIIHLITSIPMLIGTSSLIETASFCWEWILYFDKKKISVILNNIASTKVNFEFTREQKQKNEIFDLENTIEESIINAGNDYAIKNQGNSTVQNKLAFQLLLTKTKQMFNLDKSSSRNDNLYKEVELLIFSIKNKCKSTKIMHNDYITGQIILLKFLKECISEFCKSDMEQLQLIYDIIKNYVVLNIKEDLYKSPLYIYLHFFVLNLALDLTEIIQDRSDIYSITETELDEFKISLCLYGLKYFKFDKQRRVIKNKFHLSEIDQTLKNCEEMLKKEMKIKSRILERKASTAESSQKRQTVSEKVRSFINSLYSNETNINKIEPIALLENFKDLLVFLLDNEMNSLRYWNNAALSHKNTGNVFTEDKIKKIFNSIFNVNYKLCIKLVQRFPWINKKFASNLNKFGEYIYNNKKDFYNQPLALNLFIQYIIADKRNDLNSIKVMKSLIFWKFPSLNYALKYISLAYNKMIGLHKYCVHMMEHAVTKAIIFYLPQLIQSLRTDTDYQVAKFVLSKCKCSQKIGHQFLWALKVEQQMAPKTTKRYLPKGYQEQHKSEEISQILRVKILKNLNIMQRKFWLDEDDIFGRICEVSGHFLHNEGKYRHLNLKMTKDEKTSFVRSELKQIDGKIQPYIYLPTNPNYRILNLLPDTAVTLQSAKKVPFIMSFDAVEYPGPDKEVLITATSISSFIENEIRVLMDTNGNNDMNTSASVINESKRVYYKTHQSVKSFEKPFDSLSGGHQVASQKKSTVEGMLNRNLETIIEKSDIILDEDVVDSEKQVEEEKSTNIFVPKFVTQALLNKKLIHPNKNDENTVNGGYTGNYFRNSASVNVLGIADEERKNDGAFMNRSTTLNKKLNDLLNCTLSDIDFSDNEEAETDGQEMQRKALTKNKHQKDLSLINMSCIFKVGDDLRQDSLALQVIQIFQEIFKENNLNLYTYPYQTISTISPTYEELGGFIEVVKDTDSRDQIGKTYSTNLYEYYLYTFGQENSKGFRMARKNLIETLASYAIISYILQIKDRHNGNILIDKYGHLIHIDFGFIFDISPGGNMKFERAAFKLTKEMLKIMEGTESEAYSTFVDLTVRAFLACRDYMDKLLDPVVLMFSSGLDCFRENSIANFIERFKLDMSEEEAANYMREQIKVAEDNWRTNVYDFIQKKQNNISY